MPYSYPTNYFEIDPTLPCCGFRQWIQLEHSLPPSIILTRDLQFIVNYNLCISWMLTTSKAPGVCCRLFSYRTFEFSRLIFSVCADSVQTVISVQKGMVSNSECETKDWLKTSNVTLIIIRLKSITYRTIYNFLEDTILINRWDLFFCNIY